MSKPVLTFVKMMGCGPCNNFFGSPNPESSQWSTLVKDTELNKLVSFKLVEWGFDRDTKNQFKKPVHLDFIQYGPAFVLVDGADQSKHVEYDKNSPKTAANIKKWVVENAKKLNSSPAKPVTKSAPPHMPGAPRAFIPTEKLPAQLRGHVNATKVSPFAPRARPIQVPNQVATPVPTPQLQVAAPAPIQHVPVQAAPVVVKSVGLRLVSRNAQRITRRR